MLKTALTLITLFALGFIATGQAQQEENISIRLTRIEESIKASNQRIDAVEKRLEDLNISLNKRIDDTGQRIQDGFNLLASMLAAVIGLNAVMLGVAFWIARQDRPVSKKHYDKLLKQDQDLVEQFNALEGEQQNQRRRQDELAGIVQRNQTGHDRLIEEQAQKLRELEAEIAAFKRPAT
jgi:septal ring factor EnvC (AmiA/AmiB activator)